MKARLMMTVPMVTLLAGGAWAASPVDSPRLLLAQSNAQQQQMQRPAAGTPGTMGAGTRQVSEACMNELNEVRDQVADSGYGLDRRDMGTLYDAAMVFGRNGQDDACSEVVAGMKELAERAPGEMTEEQRTAYEREVANARPISEVGTLRASELIGREVVGRDGESLGDIDEVILSPQGGVQHVLIGTGGFLGLGEQQVPVKFDQLRMAGEDRMVLGVDSERFENAPRYDRSELEGRNDNWTNDVDAWWTKNVER